MNFKQYKEKLRSLRKEASNPDQDVEHLESRCSTSWMGFDDSGFEDPEIPKTLYHFAPVGSEARIKAKGIQPTNLLGGVNRLGDGVYMYGYDPSYMHDTKAGELYQIDPRGLENQLQPDYDIDGAWYHPGPIPPNRIKRLADTGHSDLTLPEGWQ